MPSHAGCQRYWARADRTPLLVIILVIGAAAGVLAAIRPARKAAKLNLLAAIASE